MYYIYYIIYIIYYVLYYIYIRTWYQEYFASKCVSLFLHWLEYIKCIIFGFVYNIYALKTTDKIELVRNLGITIDLIIYNRLKFDKVIQRLTNCFTLFYIPNIPIFSVLMPCYVMRFWSPNILWEFRALLILFYVWSL